MTTLLQRNKCNFWHLQKLFMWVWVQSWKKQEGCGDSTCGINCNHKRWIILSPLYSNHFTKSRPDNKNSNFPWHQTSAFLELYPVTNTSPLLWLCSVAAPHPSSGNILKAGAIIVNCTREFINVDKNVCLVKPSPTSSQYLLYYDTARRLCSYYIV